MGLDDHQGVLLTNEIKIKDLLSSGARLEVNHDSIKSDFLFDDDDNISDEEDDMNPSSVTPPQEMSFAELKETMQKLPLVNIYKKIMKEGNGEAVPERNARVVCHYNAFLEKTEAMSKNAAMDSTYLRKDPAVFILGDNLVLDGIDRACRTMCKGEVAQFLIPPEMAFGKMGCLPRIPPNATILYVIELVKCEEVGDSSALESLDNENKKKFPVVIVKAQEVYLRGKDHFKHGNMKEASLSFHKAITALEFCQMKSDAEEKEQREFLEKLYTNLTVCYNKLEAWTKTCLMCNELHHLNALEKNGKAMFNQGRALRHLQEYERAHRLLLKAQRLCPSNEDITRELKTLCEAWEKQRSNEKKFFENAFGIVKTVARDKQKGAADEAANVESLRKSLQDFQMYSVDKSMMLPDGLSTDEVKVIKGLVEDLELKLKISTAHDGRSVYNVTK